MDDGWNRVEIIDGGVKNLAPGEPLKDSGYFIDLPDKEKPTHNTGTRSNGTEQDAIAQEDRGDPASGRAKGLEYTDVPCLFDNDHEKRGEDSKPSNGDNHEQKNIENRGLHLDGCQQRSLRVAPRVDLNIGFVGRKLVSQGIAGRRKIRAFFQFDLNRGDGSNFG